MSANVLRSLTDENQDSGEQVGCMNVIFQLFNRRHFLTRRRIGSNRHKRLLPGQSGNHGMEPDSTMHKPTKTNLDEVVKEKRGVTVESSSPSFSSSCSSTFSSVDCNKTSQPEPSSLGHSHFLEAPSQLLSQKRPSSSPCLSQQSLDLRDVVKDSIKTMPKAERTNHVLKHIDSPRPLQAFKPVKPKVHCLDGSFPLKDTHRFSYDGRETRDTWKSIIKLKETPRLSLDSRQSSIRGSASESRSNYLLEDLERRNKQTAGVVAKLMGLEAFPYSVAANIDHMRKIDENLHAMSTTSRTVNSVLKTPPASSPGSRTIDSVLKRNSGCPLEQAPWRKKEGNGRLEKSAFLYREATKSIKTEKVVQRTRNSCSSVIPIEGMPGLRKLRISENVNKKDSVEKLSPNHLTPRNSYFIEIDKTSNVKTCKTIQTSKASQNTSRWDSTNSTTMSPKLQQKQRGMEKQSRPTTQRSDPTRSRKQLSKQQQTESGSPGRKSRPKSLIDPSSETRQLSHQCDAISVQSESNISLNSQTDIEVTSIYRSNEFYGAHKHKSQRNNIEAGLSEDRSKAETKTANLEQPSPVSVLDTTFYREGSPSPVKKKSNAFTDECQDFDDEEWNQEDLQHLLDSTGSKARTNLGLEKSENIDHLVHKIGQVNSTQDEPAIDNVSSLCEYTNPEHKYVAEILLDSTGSKSRTDFGREKSENIGHLVHKPGQVNSTQDEPAIDNVSSFCEYTNPEHKYVAEILLDSTGSKSRTDFGQEKSENIDHLVHKVGQVNSTQDEPATDNVSSFCEYTNPEHKYVAEILLATGLLFKDLFSSFTFIQHRPSGHLINPNLFLVLEQTKRTTELSYDECINEKIDHSKISEKIHRKLMFDTVNEILVRKLSSADYSGPWICPSNMGVKTLTGHKLIKELCYEVDQLQAIPNSSIHNDDDDLRSILSKDTMYQTPIWEDCHCEIPGIVLEIERLIFKDLINEVVGGEVAGHPRRPATHCKRLFPD